MMIFYAHKQRRQETHAACVRVDVGESIGN
jgi:hypothetical protein